MYQVANVHAESCVHDNISFLTSYLYQSSLTIQHTYTGHKTTFSLHSHCYENLKSHNVLSTHYVYKVLFGRFNIFVVPTG